MSLRILQIMNRVPWPLKDGGSLGFYNYIKGYHDAGCEVTVCALNTNKHYYAVDELPGQVKQLADWRTVAINTDVRTGSAFLNLFSGKSYNIERFISKEFEALILKTLKEKKFDVVIFESVFVTPYYEAVKQNSDALLILRQHNVEHRIWETLAAGEKNGVKKMYLQLLARRMKKYELRQLNRFDGITTVTAEDAAVFRESGCVKPIFVSPFGIDLDRFQMDNSSLERKSVFHIGSMEWMPNREAISWFLEEVWAKVVRIAPDARFYLAGRGMPPSFAEAAIPNVHVEGEVEDAVKFMQDHQVMIVPLFSGSGIRVKILEGMALGKTIVSTGMGVRGIECDNNKHLLVADTAAEFVHAILRLLEDQDLCDELGQQARMLVEERYDNEKVIADVLDFYGEQPGLNRGRVAGGVDH